MAPPEPLFPADKRARRSQALPEPPLPADKRATLHTPSKSPSVKSKTTPFLISSVPKMMMEVGTGLVDNSKAVNELLRDSRNLITQRHRKLFLEKAKAATAQAQKANQNFTVLREMIEKSLQ